MSKEINVSCVHRPGFVIDCLMLPTPLTTASYYTQVKNRNPADSNTRIALHCSVHVQGRHVEFENGFHFLALDVLLSDPHDLPYSRTSKPRPFISHRRRGYRLNCFLIFLQRSTLSTNCEVPAPRRLFCYVIHHPHFPRLTAPHKEAKR